MQSKKKIMKIRDVHGLECPQCKLRDQFYEDFNTDSNKNVSYFGVISYVDNYVMPGSSDQPKEDLSRNGRSCKPSSGRFLQLVNEFAIRELIAKPGNKKKHLKEKKKKPCPKPPPFYFPEDVGNVMIVKKSASYNKAYPMCSLYLSPT